ncbi:hypothetical protein AB0I84_12105 [Streptomyces spectabilis]|uniref:hypothetical protein n=1 Tax=Streptomyces spectabilis TaxID=68270 RepID=UPI00340ABA8B
MPHIHDVPDDWNPRHRCCLECGNRDPQVTLRALTHTTTNQQALACTRHLTEVSAVLDSFAAEPPLPPGRHRRSSPRQHRPLYPPLDRGLGHDSPPGPG